MEFVSVTPQIKRIEPYFAVVMLIVLFKVVLLIFSRVWMESLRVALRRSTFVWCCVF